MYRKHLTAALKSHGEERDPRNSECGYDCEVRKVRFCKTPIVSLLQPPPPSLLIGSSIISTDRSGQVSSRRRPGLDLLSHLFGTVVGQTQAHDGQHHGYLVDGTVLWLRLHLTSNLPLQGQKTNRIKVRGDNEPQNMFVVNESLKKQTFTKYFPLRGFFPKTCNLSKSQPSAV